MRMLSRTAPLLGRVDRVLEITHLRLAKACHVLGVRVRATTRSHRARACLVQVLGQSETLHVLPLLHLSDPVAHVQVHRVLVPHRVVRVRTLA